MAGANYSIRLDGIEHIRERINELLMRGQNLEPAFQDIGEMLLLSHNERWAKQESPDGQPWQPLSEDYKKRKKKNQSLILVLNQHLGRELNYNAWRTGMTFGTPYEYGAIHHFGGTSDMRPQNEAIAARPWLGVSDEDTEQIYQILGDFLTAD